MIIETIVTSLVDLICTVFSVVPSIPNIPNEVALFIGRFLDLIFGNLGLLNFFLPIDTIKVAVPLAIIIINFDHIIDFVMWILKKIPMLSVE